MSDLVYRCPYCDRRYARSTAREKLDAARKLADTVPLFSRGPYETSGMSQAFGSPPVSSTGTIAAGFRQAGIDTWGDFFREAFDGDFTRIKGVGPVFSEDLHRSAVQAWLRLLDLAFTMEAVET